MKNLFTSKLVSNLIIVIFSLGFVLSAHAASPIGCSAEYHPPGLEGDENAMVIAVDTLTATDCKNTKGQTGEVILNGIGAGIRISSTEFAISCPLVRRSKINGKYYGVRISAVPGIGATVGVFTNARLGTCFLTGIEVGIGAGATIESLEINMND